MSNIPSPILIFGDLYLSKNNIINAKKKYPDSKWITLSADESLDKIRAESGLSSWDEKEKILVIESIPNRKQVREFLLNLIKTIPSTTKIIIWDSDGHIKIDSKTKSIDKGWMEFIKEFRAVSGSKIVNNGEVLEEKKGDDCVSFVIHTFDRYKKKIDSTNAKLLIGLVGYDRGMLDSEIKKMCLICSDYINSEFIIENAFPSTKESILYKFGNILDEGSLEDSITVTDKFLASGFNANELAVVLARKARWQMVVAYYFSSGMNWESIPSVLMEMGKFPSSIWHNDQMELSRKKYEASVVQSSDNMVKYMSRKEGLPRRYFHMSLPKNTAKEKTTMTRKNAEIMPMYFMAEQVVKFVRDKIVYANRNMPEKELKEKLLYRAIRVYSFILDKMCEIRYGEDPEQDLHEMVRSLIATNLESF